MSGAEEDTSDREAAIHEIGSQCEGWTSEEVILWAANTFGSRVEIASGLGAKGIVLIDMARCLELDLRVFMLDTGFLFAETHELAEKIEERYGLRIERVSADLTPQEQAERHSPGLWKKDPDLCCDIRKVNPLRRKLDSLDAWMTAIRRDQTPSRRTAGKIEWDSQFKLAKINPLAGWNRDSVWEYIRKHRLDYNPLHNQRYPSIGCTHCTRPVRAGEAARAGRWPGFSKVECGLHVRRVSD
jgi:phosphoadenosine phosphosulfate reductase